MKSHVTLTVTSVETCVSCTICVFLYPRTRHWSRRCNIISQIYQFYRASCCWHSISPLNWRPPSDVTRLPVQIREGRFRLWFGERRLHWTRVGRILKVTRRSFGGGGGELSWPSERKRCNSESWQIFQLNFTGISHIWSGIGKCIQLIFLKMAANMAVKMLNQMYISSAVRYTDKCRGKSYEVKVVEFKYVKIDNNNSIIFKTAAKMAADN